MNDSDLRVFRSPESQPKFNPTNCGAVAGQLLGLVTPKTADEMTQLKQGGILSDWISYISKTLEQPVTYFQEDITSFQSFFMKYLFPGFATIVVTVPIENYGHSFIVAKSADNRLVILDPQLRTGYFDISQYFTKVLPSHRRFLVFIRDTPRTAKQHETDYMSFLAEAVKRCNISSGEVYMDVEAPPPQDVIMSGGTSRRKRRKTKRRLIAKRTLRRMNRRRRIF